MEGIAKDFKDKGVVFYMLYTKEPHAAQKMGKFDFTDTKQTKTHEERVDYGAKMIQEYSQARPVLIDLMDKKDNLQQKIGGGWPNSLIVVDGKGKVALWQNWSDPAALRKKLEEMTGMKPGTSRTDDGTTITETLSFRGAPLKKPAPKIDGKNRRFGEESKTKTIPAKTDSP